MLQQMCGVSTILKIRRWKAAVGRPCCTGLADGFSPNLFFQGPKLRIQTLEEHASHTPQRQGNLGCLGGALYFSCSSALAAANAPTISQEIIALHHGWVDNALIEADKLLRLPDLALEQDLFVIDP